MAVVVAEMMSKSAENKRAGVWWDMRAGLLPEKIGKGKLGRKTSGICHSESFRGG